LKDLFGPNMRIIMIQVMYGDNDYSLSNQMIQRVLNSFGHGVSIETTNAQIQWLKERGLVSTEDLGNGMVVAKLTRAGVDLAEGHSRVEGVDRPLPLD